MPEPQWRQRWRDGGVPRNADLSKFAELVSTGDGGLPLAKYRWSVPDLDSVIDVPVVQMVNGLPVRFSAAVSHARPDFLVKYYVDAFDKAGLYIPEADSQMTLGPPLMQVTALDTDSLISYTVILQVVDEQHTTVIMGQGYLTQWLNKNRVEPEADFAPLFPKAESVVRTHSEGADLIQYSCKADAAAIQTFYKDVLAKTGYRTSENEAFTFARGRERVSVTVKAIPGTKDTGVLLQKRLAPRSE